MRIECPSGLVGEARKIRGEEMSQLADRAESGAGGDILSPIVRACWTSTIDPGPYQFAKAGDAKFDWTQVALSDVHYAMIQIRIASLPDGHDYGFLVKCESCRESYAWHIDLRKLPVTPMPEDTRLIISGGGGVFPTVVNDVHVEYQVRRLSQVEPLRKELKALKRKGMSLTESVAMQITRFGEARDMRKIYRLVRELDWDQVIALRDEMDATEGGIQLSGLESKCEHCRWEQEYTLPFGRTFFRPQRSKPTKAAEEEPSDGESTESQLSSEASLVA